MFDERAFEEGYSIERERNAFYMDVEELIDEEFLEREADMREILFRGKIKADGEWAYGFFYSECGNHYIVEDLQNESELSRKVAYRVDPETVGEYTGLKDKNGAKIFEGDIVKADLDFNPNDRVGLIRKVIFQKGMFCLCCRKNYNIYQIDGFHNIEVIGNIHDNPKLLETS